MEELNTFLNCLDHNLNPEGDDNSSSEGEKDYPNIYSISILVIVGYGTYMGCKWIRKNFII